MTLGPAYTTMRHPKLQLYKITTMQRLADWNSGARIHFYSSLLWSIHNGIVNPQLFLLQQLCIPALHGYVNTPNTKYLSSENSHHLHEHPLPYVNVKFWHAVNSNRICLYKKQISSF
jgi:hypothetical protein